MDKQVNRLPEIPTPNILAERLELFCEIEKVLSDDTVYRKVADGHYRIEAPGGDHLVFVSSDKASLIKGFDHESEVSPHAQNDGKIWPGIYESLPSDLLSLLGGSGEEEDEVTFCIWHTPPGSKWEIGPVQYPPDDDGGIAFLSQFLLYSKEEFADWAIDYYGLDIQIEAFLAFCNGQMGLEEFRELLEKQGFDMDKVVFVKLSDQEDKAEAIKVLGKLGRKKHSKIKSEFESHYLFVHNFQTVPDGKRWKAIDEVRYQLEVLEGKDIRLKYYIGPSGFDDWNEEDCTRLQVDMATFNKFLQEAMNHSYQSPLGHP